MASEQFSISVLFRVINQATGPLRKLGREFAQLGKSAQRMGQSMQQVGRTMTTALTLPLVGFGALAVRTATKFQATMNMVGAVTKATEAEFLALNNQAKELGSTTQFSAVQAAEGMKFLGQAGFKANKVIASMPATLQLAASAQLDLGSSADIVTNVMTGYGIAANKLNMVNDTLVNAFTNANTNLSQLGQAFKFAGPVAKGAGLDFQTTVGTLASLGNAGIQATMAGTAVRGMLAKLQSPTRDMAKGMRRAGVNLREFVTPKGGFKLISFINKLAKSSATSGQVMKAFGLRAGPAMNILLSQAREAPGALEKFIKKLREQGSAARVAAAQMRGLPGAFLLLKSAFEGFQLSLISGRTGKALENFIRQLAGFFQWLTKLRPATLRWIVIIGGIAAAIGPLLIAIGLMAAGFGTLLTLSIPLLANFALMATGFAALAAGAVLVVKNWDKVGPALAEALRDVPTVFEEWNRVLTAGGVEGLRTRLIENVIDGWQIYIDFWNNELKPVFKEIEEFITGGKLVSNLTDFLFGAGAGEAAERARVTDELLAAGITPNANVNALGPVDTSAILPGATTQSKTDVTIRVAAEEGSTATVESIRKTGDDANATVNLNTVGFVGAQ